MHLPSSFVALAMAATAMAGVSSPLAARADVACKTADDEVGTCKSISSTCNGIFVEDLCPGPTTNQCCVPTGPDPAAADDDGDGGIGDDDGPEAEEGIVSDTEALDDLDLKESTSLLDAAGDGEVSLAKRSPAALEARGKNRGQLVYAAAAKWLGRPYVWGGGNCKGPTKGGFDCSGLVLHAVCKVTKKHLPHKAQLQYKSPKCKRIPRSKGIRGDAVFWAKNGNCKSGIKHVALLKDKKYIINAPRKGKPVRVQKLWTKSGNLRICPYAVRC